MCHRRLKRQSTPKLGLLDGELEPEPASQLFKLHKQLNTLVLQAYSFSPDDDLLDKLLALNLELPDKEKNGEAVVGSWAPTS